MKNKFLVVSLLVVLTLAGCSGGGGPSKAEASEAIHGVYIQEVSIVERQQCELTAWMAEEGHTNIWLVRYRFVESGSEGGMLLTETESAEYPWQPYLLNLESCPAAE